MKSKSNSVTLTPNDITCFEQTLTSTKITKLKLSPSLSITELKKSHWRYLKTEFQIKKIDFSDHDIERIPKSIFQFRHLTVLNLEGNMIEGVPRRICKMRMLRYLNLRRFGVFWFEGDCFRNRIMCLPEEIGELEELVEVDVSYTNVVGLPLSLGESGVQKIGVKGNLMVSPPVNVCVKGMSGFWG